MNKQYNLGCGLFTEKAKVKTDTVTFTIGHGENIDERTLYFEIYQNSNADIVSIVGLEYGWNREFLNKISEGFKKLLSEDYWGGIRLDQEKWKEYCGIDLSKEIDENINQLRIHVDIPFKMSSHIILNNAATPEILIKLSETFAELAEKETDYLVPNFERWSY